jgi:hypothetical protein
VKRIVFLAILFAALIEFAMERERFDLWIVSIATVTLLWDYARRALRSRAGPHKPNQNASDPERDWTPELKK